jgi:amidase
LKHSLLILSFIISYSIKGQKILPATEISGKATHINFIPTSFSNMFSLNITPVLKIRSGDTVLTETIDAGGVDKNGVKRQKGGNPLTGPFYIENTSPGDVLAVTLTKVVLNRSSAFTTESFSSRSLPKTIIHEMTKSRLVKWKLDTQTNFAILNDSSYEHLHSFKVPLKPF